MGNRIMYLVLCVINGIFAEEVKDIAAGAKLVEEDDPVLHSLHAVLISKMSDARNTVLHGSPTGDVHVLDPFKMEPLSLTVQEPKGFVNVSLRKINVEGLGNFQLKDIVTNMDVLRTSVLMRFPEIQIKASYKLKGFLNPPFSQSLADEGLFEAKVKDGAATWIGRIELKDTPSSDDSILSLSQASFRTYWDAASHSFTSFLKKNERALEQAGELLQAVSAAVVEKVQKLAEEGLEQAIAHVMGRAKPTSWFEMYPSVAPDVTSTVIDPDFELLEEDTSPFITETHSEGGEGVEGFTEGRSRRKKRQVPCENGEGLDEYVDTLLRFGRRLIRFQEPIPFPNTTIKIDDMLTVFLYNGGLRGVSNLSRRKNAYVKCTNTSTTLGMVVRIENLRINFKYRVLQDYRLLLFNGDAETRVREVIILIQLTQSTLPNGETRQTLDRLKIWKLGHTTVRLRGLGNLTSALSMLITHQVNEDPKAVIPVAEAQITHIVRQQLNNVTIPIFSII